MVNRLCYSSMIFLFLVLIAGAAIDKGHEIAAEKIEVFAAKIEKKEIKRKISFPGVVKSKRQSPIYAENSGVIVKLKKQLGGIISKNEIIGYIENPDPVYQFKPLPIRSSIAGRITEMNFFEGSQVQKGALLMTITDPKSVIVEVQIPARDLPSIKIGREAEFKTSPSAKLKVVGLSPTSDASTLTATAVFSIEDSRAAINPGLQGQVEYIAESKLTYIIPEDHIVRRNQKTYIRKIVNNLAVFQEIFIGERFEDQLEVTSGVSEGDVYITRTAKHVKDGDQVTYSEISK